MNIGILWVGIGAGLVVLMQAQALHLARVNRRLAERDEALQKRNSQLDSANVKLREVGLIKSRLLANASRELKNPLQGILKAADTLTCYPSADAEAIYRLGDTVAWEAGRLDRLIGTILDLVELESRSAVWNEGVVHPETLLKKALASVDEIAKRQAVRVETVVDGQVPALWGDEKRLARALDVLLQNAVNYSHKGGKVTARITANGPEVVFSVEESRSETQSDQPPAIKTPSEQPDLGNLPIRDSIGVGLGLNLCRQIVERHNGRIWAESTAARGQRFSMALSAFDGEEGVAGHA